MEEVRFIGISLQESSYRPITAKWEKCCTEGNATRVLDDCDEIMVQIHKAAGLSEPTPFFFGLSEMLSTLLTEETPKWSK